ncbi:hypothetical protein AcV7_010364 [Taiwanofungus camphoratus]|nr:hypothetical protein AcV7_010364 [Antrodia cinnamomea]
MKNGTDLLFKLFRARKGVVPQIDIALQGESEFASPVKCKHQFWGWRLHIFRDSHVAAKAWSSRVQSRQVASCHVVTGRVCHRRLYLVTSREKTGGVTGKKKQANYIYTMYIPTTAVHIRRVLTDD